MKKHVSIFFLLSFFAFIGCKSVPDPMIELKQNLGKDDDFNRFSVLSKDFREKSAYDYYTYSKVNVEKLNSELPKATNLQEVIAVYKASGFSNAEEYVTSSQERSKLMSTIINRYPLLKEIGNQKTSEIFMELMTKPRLDKDKIFNSNHKKN